MKHLNIELVNPSQTYFSGELIEGRVTIETDSPLKVKEVSILLEGEGRVHWSLTESFVVTETKTVDGKIKSVPKKKSRVVAYSEHEKYISQRISLAGDAHNTLTLPKGTTTYPFQFSLPTNCPSSFITKFGYVAYLLEAELKRPKLKRDKKTCLPFTVNGMLDLNSESGANQPQQLQRIKGSNWFACRTGQLHFVLHLPRSGFVPGQILDFYCEIRNQCCRSVKKVKASLNQVVQYQARLIRKVERRVICAVKGAGLEAGEDRSWQPDSIRVPSLPPTRLGGMCRIIDVQYFLQFQAIISGLSKPLIGELPVMIGTKSLKDSEGVSNQLQASTSQRRSEVEIKLVDEDGVEQQFTTLCTTDIPD